MVNPQELQVPPLNARSSQSLFLSCFTNFTEEVHWWDALFWKPFLWTQLLANRSRYSSWMGLGADVKDICFSDKIPMNSLQRTLLIEVFLHYFRVFFEKLGNGIRKFSISIASLSCRLFFPHWESDRSSYVINVSPGYLRPFWY